MNDLAEHVRRIVEEGDDADDILRAVVDALAASPGVSWAAIAFTEDGTLGVGPTSGRPDEASRVHVAVTYEGTAIGELWVDGDLPRDDLERIAELVAPYVLIGWDTRGEVWDP